jgi:hypothetical protein
LFAGVIAWVSDGEKRASDGRRIYSSILGSYRDAGPPQSVKNNGVYFSRFFSDIQKLDAWRLPEPLEFQPNRPALNVPE